MEVDIIINIVQIEQFKSVLEVNPANKNSNINP